MQKIIQKNSVVFDIYLHGECIHEGLPSYEDCYETIAIENRGENCEILPRTIVRVKGLGRDSDLHN